MCLDNRLKMNLHLGGPHQFGPNYHQVVDKYLILSLPWPYLLSNRDNFAFEIKELE